MKVLRCLLCMSLMLVLSSCEKPPRIRNVDMFHDALKNEVPQSALGVCTLAEPFNTVPFPRWVYACPFEREVRKKKKVVFGFTLWTGKSGGESARSLVHSLCERGKELHERYKKDQEAPEYLGYYVNRGKNARELSLCIEPDLMISVSSSESLDGETAQSIVKRFLDSSLPAIQRIFRESAF